MEENGFNVEAIKTEDMYSTKVNAGIDMSLSSCHTGFIGDYFVEGHVPHDAIEKLLNERPNIKGITVPGMPSGINVLPFPASPLSDSFLTLSPVGPNGHRILDEEIL